MKLGGYGEDRLVRELTRAKLPVAPVRSEVRVGIGD